MSFDNIRGALVSAYQGGGFALPTAYENRDFEPPAAEPWAAVSLIPNQPSAASIGEHGQDEHDGIFQVDLHYPRNQGDGLAVQKADAIRAVFKAGAKFTYNSQTVTVRSCGRSRGRVVDGWFRITVTVNWYALTAR